MERVYTSGDVSKILDYRGARQNILTAEKSGLIPSADRGVKRTKATRTWKTADLNKIGRLFGVFEPLAETPVFTVFQSKGGQLKSNLVLNLSRTLALGLRATKKIPDPKGIILGLDNQSSISFCLKNPVSLIDNLSQWEPPLTIADFVHKSASLDSIIVNTDLPSLDLIPESVALSDLEKELGIKLGRHKWLEPILKELKKKYQFIFIDLSPSFSVLSEASLFSGSLHIFPVSCEIGAYSVMNSNFSMIQDFYETIGAEPTPQIIVPTKLANNKISKQVHQAYLQQYEDVSMTTIPSKIIGSEAESLGISVSEYAPTCDLAESYFELTKEVWEKVGGKLSGT